MKESADEIKSRSNLMEVVEESVKQVLPLLQQRPESYYVGIPPPAQPTVSYRVYVEGDPLKTGLPNLDLFERREGEPRVLTKEELEAWKEEQFRATKGEGQSLGDVLPLRGQLSPVHASAQSPAVVAAPSVYAPAA